jgi:hypothetical protein
MPETKEISLTFDQLNLLIAALGASAMAPGKLALLNHLLNVRTAWYAEMVARLG